MFSVLFLFSCTTQFKHQSGNNSNLGNDTRYCKATANSQAPTYICRNPFMCAPDETSIVLNHKFIADGLNAVDATALVIQMNDGNSPAVLRPAETLDGAQGVAKQDYLYIIMPIKQ